MRINSDQIETFLHSNIERMDLDLLFECLANLIVLNCDLDPAQIHVVPIDNHRRNYKNDLVSAPREYEGEPVHYLGRHERNIVQLFTSRNAILDYLPEDYYAEPDNTDEFWTETGEERDPKDVEAYRKRVKEELESAQRFFRPLEVAYNQVRICREIFENESVGNQDQLLQSFWSEFPTRTDAWKRFVRTLHLVPHIVGDLEKTTALIEYVLHKPVKTRIRIDPVASCSDQELNALTSTKPQLGYNVIFGQSIYDYLQVCTLEIEELSTDEFYSYFDEDSDEWELLQAITQHYFPLDVEVELDFAIKKEKITAEGDVEIPILGYSSALGE